MPSTFLNLLEARPIAVAGKKERTSSQISREARPSALTEIWKRRVKWGHTISPIHFTQPSTQLLTVKLVVSPQSQIHSYAYHLVSVCGHNQHVRSPIQGFSRCEGISFTPAFNKDQHSRGFCPKNGKIISLPLAPRQSPHPPKLAHGVRHAAPKRKSRTGCKSDAESLHAVHLLRANVLDVIAKSAKTSSSPESPTSESES